MLFARLRAATIEVQQADADVMIAETALDFDAPGRKVSVVGGHGHRHLVHLGCASLGHHRTAISVKHPDTISSGDALFDIGAIRRQLGAMVSCVLAAHAFTGCDTVSAVYMMGKVNSWDNLKVDAGLRGMAAMFNDGTADRDSIARCGEYCCPCTPRIAATAAWTYAAIRTVPKGWWKTQESVQAAQPSPLPAHLRRHPPTQLQGVSPGAMMAG